ncbi:MAG: alanine--tRNA ligase [Erysipelotrichales bacterium]|nr:alanine--tRNA ligase [Erysipelotrichales bacterium]
MKNLKGNEVRSLFLKYFEERGHMVEPGASLVPHNDPTLLWINSGVAALKKYFDGSEKPKCNRITNAQKSIRTNDIENVGKTSRHHTFFEMLGNFSIGDYFKKEAIPFAWHFLTDEEWIGFDKDRMYITVYSDDTEAYDIWTKDLGVDPSHILKTPNNFWQIGEGPCGPDTEIFYDRGPEYDPQGLGERAFFEELENDRYIEVWNVVFSQYDGKEGVDRKDYQELPQKNIDTGMGLERLVSLIQGGETNFDTDLFMPYIEATQEMAVKKYEGDNKMSYRVIADHVRTVTFALADGALFSNEGRGYVLRRLLRRAARYARKIGINGAFLDRLVPVVVENMKEYYPYLEEKCAYVQKLVKAEEERFIATLNEGERLMNEVIAQNKGKTTVISGETAFMMYDTYGFPYELTLEMAEENGFTVDEEGFKNEMEKQRQRARNAREDAESMSSQAIDLMNFDTPSEFVGYVQESAEAEVIGLFVNGCKVDVITESGEAIFNVTPFYAESGGQTHDSGSFCGEGICGKISEVRKAPHKQHLHKVTLEEGSLKVGDKVTLSICTKKRNAIRANHSVTHLLQAALRNVIGTHIQQAGSYNCDEYMRFDFTHFEKISDEDLRKIETIVNDQIAAHLPVVTQVMDVEEAKSSGAMALFDEKYDDKVRVVSMGTFSKELCGGTHVSNTSEIGVFKIVSEESVGSGIRRITGKTAIGAYDEFKALEDKLWELADFFKLTNLDMLMKRVTTLTEELSTLKKVNDQLNSKILTLEADELLSKITTYNEIPTLVIHKDGLEINDMKELANTIKNKAKSVAVVVVSASDDKVTYVAGVTKDLNDKGILAGNMIKAVSALCEGRGGGKPDLAQGGAKDITSVMNGISKVLENLGK